MRVLVTGYSAQHVNPANTGTFASLLASTFVQAGHLVTQDAPRAYLQNDREYDHVFMGLGSPIGNASRHSASALILIDELRSNITFFADDPNLRAITGGHRRIVKSPDDMKSDYIKKNQTANDRAMISKRIDRVISGAEYLISAHAGLCLTPRHSWIAGNRLSHELPPGCSQEVPIDCSGMLLHRDRILELGLQAMHQRGYVKKRSSMWVTERKTSSRAKNLWISGTEANTCSPSIPAANVRTSLSNAFAQMLVSQGVLEQSPSALTPGWWSPWIALAAAGGAFYATDSEHANALGPPFAVLPPQFEKLRAKDKKLVTDEQRELLTDLVSTETPDKIVKLATQKLEAGR